MAFDGPSHLSVTGVARPKVDAAAREFGLKVTAGNQPSASGTQHSAAGDMVAFRAPRIAMYQPWTGGNMDEGWTRWVLEQYEFNLTSIHNADIRAGKLRQKFDAIILADQNPRDIVDGYDCNAIRPEYRGGIGDAGVDNLKRFVADGGTLVTMGNACDLAIERFPIPVRNLKKGLTRDQHFAPGAILRVEVDTQHPIGYGVAADTYGFYINSPFFDVVDGFASQKTTVVARYPNTNVIASGWLKGEDLMAGRAAVVSIDMNPGRVVLFGLRPQHRAQTHATFPLLFNALYLSATDLRRQRLHQPSSSDAVIRIFVTGGTFDKEYNELTGIAVLQGHAPAARCCGSADAASSRRSDADDDRQPRHDRRRPRADRRAVPAGAAKRASSSRTAPTRWSRPRARWPRPTRRSTGKTIVLTGAMMPYAFGSSDGLFNLGSALSFVQVLPPGVYVAMNGRCFRWNSVRKNRETGIFEDF